MFDDLFKEIRRLQREINRSFGEFFESEPLKALPDYSDRSFDLMRTPLTDIEENDKEIIVKFEIPGVDKKDIQLNVTENRVEVKVEKKQEAKVEKKGYIRHERSYTGFYRSIPLPTEVNPDKAKAKYKDGVLEVTIPKVESKKKSRIEIE